MTQTAVEWLVRELNQEFNYIPITQWDRIRDIVQRAKEMERDQIIEAHDAAYIAMNLAFRGFERSVEYYEKTYGSDT
jgi:hypothetical protein